MQSDQDPQGPVAAPWEQQTAETSRQFAVFQTYRDLHPLERSLALVGRKLGVSTSYVERLSAERDWVERVRAFDQHQDRSAQARRARRIEEMNERHAEIAAVALTRIAERLQTLEPSLLKPNDIARLLDVASRAERLALGAFPGEDDAQPPQVGFSAATISAKLKAQGRPADGEPVDLDDLLIPDAERAGYLALRPRADPDRGDS